MNTYYAHALQCAHVLLQCLCGCRATYIHHTFDKFLHQDTTICSRAHAGSAQCCVADSSEQAAVGATGVYSVVVPLFLHAVVLTAVTTHRRVSQHSTVCSSAPLHLLLTDSIIGAGVCIIYPRFPRAFFHFFPATAMFSLL